MERSQKGRVGMRGIKNITLNEALEGLEEFPREVADLVPLSEFLFTMFAGVLCGATTYADMAQLGRLRPELYQEYFSFANGNPSAWSLHDIASRLRPDRIYDTLADWMMRPLAEYRAVRELEKHTLKRSELNMAACSDRDLMQVACTASSGQQITLGAASGSGFGSGLDLVLELLEMFDTAGATITFAAPGVRQQAANVLFERGSDYVLPVDSGRRAQTKELTEYFAGVSAGNHLQPGIAHAAVQDAGDGVTECWVCSSVSELPLVRKWQDAHGAAMLRRQRSTEDTDRTQYIVFSRPGMTPEEIIGITSKLGWDGEPSLDWMLDLSWRDEDGRVRTDHTAENLNAIRSSTIRVLHQLNDETRRLRGLQQYCLLSDRYFNAAIELAGFTLNA